MKKLISKAMTPQTQSPCRSKATSDPMIRPMVGRRSFLKGLGATSAMLLPASALLANKPRAADDDSGGKLSRGDASILRFLAAAEILEADLWEQYWELSSAAGIAHRGDFASAINPNTGKPPVGTGATCRTRPLFSSWTATCPSTLSTIPMMNSATRTSYLRT